MAASPVVARASVSGEMIGEALVPYYRQILPVLNIFKPRNSALPSVSLPLLGALCCCHRLAVPLLWLP